MSLTALTLALAIGGAAPAHDPARAELDAVADRIAELKARRPSGWGAGRELERLLVRAQELAIAIERRDASGADPPDAGPGADELRERADALHDEADRLAAELVAVDGRIAAEAARGPATPGARRAAATTRAAGGGDVIGIEALRVRRAELAAELESVRATAAALEAEAELEPDER